MRWLPWPPMTWTRPDGRRRRVQVEYERLPFVMDPVAALEPGRASDSSRGQPGHPGAAGAAARGRRRGICSPPTSSWRKPTTCPRTQPRRWKPRAALASWDGNQLTVWKSTRGVHVDRMALASVLGIDAGQVRVIGPNMGGGYGNKDESRIAVLAAMLSRRADRPVRIEYSREGRVCCWQDAARRTDCAAGRRHAGRGHHGHPRRRHPWTPERTRRPRRTWRDGRAKGCCTCIGAPTCDSTRGRWLPTSRCRAATAPWARPQGHFALETLMDRAAEAIGMDPAGVSITEPRAARGTGRHSRDAAG